MVFEKGREKGIVIMVEMCYHDSMTIKYSHSAYIPLFSSQKMDAVIKNMALLESDKIKKVSFVILDEPIDISKIHLTKEFVDLSNEFKVDIENFINLVLRDFVYFFEGKERSLLAKILKSDELTSEEKIKILKVVGDIK